MLAPLVLLLSCCLDGSAAAPATSGDRVEAPAVLAELLAGRALVAGERSVDALAPGGARALPSAALLQVPAGSRVRVSFQATGSLLLEGPVEVAWGPTESGRAPMTWRFTRLGSAHLESRGEGVRLELPGGWYASTGACALWLAASPLGELRVHHDGGRALDLRRLGARRDGPTLLPGTRWRLPTDPTLTGAFERDLTAELAPSARSSAPVRPGSPRPGFSWSGFAWPWGAEPDRPPTVPVAQPAAPVLAPTQGAVADAPADALSGAHRAAPRGPVQDPAPEPLAGSEPGPLEPTVEPGAGPSGVPPRPDHDGNEGNEGNEGDELDDAVRSPEGGSTASLSAHAIPDRAPGPDVTGLILRHALWNARGWLGVSPLGRPRPGVKMRREGRLELTLWGVRWAEN